jgi:hypothetical protein
MGKSALTSATKMERALPGNVTAVFPHAPVGYVMSSLANALLTIKRKEQRAPCRVTPTQLARVVFAMAVLSPATRLSFASRSRANALRMGYFVPKLFATHVRSAIR